ncbi:uncharacterized protein LOC115240770 [Formica exsecta]|uniref:uncharacterized protein LOC115240770 n=1 Tax=Formica exsecta TaxID=72781 RepID=UPI0011425757|nr:uncharacterized protein LOC115240770 [Formica exsecta]
MRSKDKKCDKDKKSRHVRAKKNYSSSEEYESDSGKNKKGTKFIPFPTIPEKLYITNNKISASQKFHTSIPSSCNVERSKSECQMSPAIHTKNSCEEATINRYIERNLSDENSNSYNFKIEKYKNMCTENNNLITTENEFQREVIRKLQLLLNKMTVLENRMVLLETSSLMRHCNYEAADVIQYEEYDLPLETIAALKHLEELLKDRSFADKMVRM